MKDPMVKRSSGGVLVGRSQIARTAAVLVAIVGLGCTAAPRPTPAAPAADRCVGTITAPEGFRVIDDAALHGQAVGAPGAGKLCEASTYEVTAPVRVYRVWNSAQTFSADGRWWTLTPPTGTREAYRTANAVCPEWSALDRVRACDLTVGTHVALGTGQSVRCEGGATFAVSEALQLFVPNDTRATPPRLFVEHCTESAPWP